MFSNNCVFRLNNWALKMEMLIIKTSAEFNAGLFCPRALILWHETAQIKFISHIFYV